MDRQRPRDRSAAALTTIEVIGRDGCHLCPTALEIVETVVAELPEVHADGIEIVERSIDDDAVLHELWWQKIPVVLIDGEFHAQWRVSAEALRQKLTQR